MKTYYLLSNGERSVISDCRIPGFRLRGEAVCRDWLHAKKRFFGEGALTDLQKELLPLAPEQRMQKLNFSPYNMEMLKYPGYAGAWRGILPKR